MNFRVSSAPFIGPPMRLPKPAQRKQKPILRPNSEISSTNSTAIGADSPISMESQHIIKVILATKFQLTRSTKQAIKHCNHHNIRLSSETYHSKSDDRGTEGRENETLHYSKMVHYESGDYPSNKLTEVEDDELY
jgi:hypothetical protein